MVSVSLLKLQKLSLDIILNIILMSPRLVYSLNAAEAILKTIPVKTGSFELLVCFKSTQLTDIIGSEDVKIVP